jgi:methionine biosynthesis protein MetW
LDSSKHIEILANLISPHSRVLDLGCGDGSFLQYLIEQRGCQGYGIELDDENVKACVKRGINVLQLDLEQGLKLFENQSFDVVLQMDTLQHLKNAQTMLKETARVGKMGIVTFPNFAHWPNRFSVFQGRMPVTKHLPYEWYDTPNIRVGTFKDFEALAHKNQLKILQAFGLENQQKIDFLPNLRASTAVFKFTT